MSLAGVMAMLTYANVASVCAIFRLLIVSVMSASNQIHNLPHRIPIGSLFTNTSIIIKTAYRYEMEKYNNSTASTAFKLEKYDKTADFFDSYDVSRAMCAALSKGTFALVGVTNRATLNTVDAFGRTFHMPYVTPSSPSNDSSMAGGLMGASSTLLHHTSASATASGFTVYMRPLYDRALMDVILHYRWPKIFYVYDNSEGLYRLERLYDVINEQNYTLDIEAVRLRDVDQSYMTLRQLDSHEPVGANKYIVLDLSTEEALVSILKQIQAVGMNRGGYHYLLGGIAMDELDIDDFKHGGVNITGFNLVNRTSQKTQSIQKEWGRLDPRFYHGAGNGSRLKLEAALTIDAVSVITAGLTTILNDNPEEFRDIFRRGHVYNNGTVGIQCKQEKTPWMKGATILKRFKQVYFHGATGVVAFDEFGYRKDYKLGVHELNLNNEPREIAIWDYNKGLSKIGSTDGQDADDDTNQKTFNATRIIVTTIRSSPFLSYKKKQEDDKDKVGSSEHPQYEGYCAELTSLLAQIVGFEYILQEVADGKYGAKTENGTWNGMVGELTTRKADVAIAPLTISSIRERVIDFSKPFMNLGISIMIKKPEKQKPGVFSFMDPLAIDIWACIVISYLGVSFVLFLVSRFSPYEWQIEDKESGPSFTNDFTMLNSLWFSLGAFMRQGCDISPRSLSGRVVGSAWWFFTLIIISSYTANLAAFLTVERMLTPIEGADDLAKQREIMYGTLDAGSTLDFFKNSKITTYERMWDFMSNNKDVFVKTTEEGVLRVRNSKGKYAFLLESTMNDFYNQKKPCNTMKVGGDLDSKGYGVATPIGSHLREPIGLAILQLLEKGSLAKLHKKWWYDKGECVPEDTKGGSSSQSALTLSNVAGIFYILIGGLGLSMIMSLLEFIYKSRREILRQKKTFTETARPKTRMSVGSSPDRENGGYSYSAPTQVSGFEHYAEVRNTHTQV